MAKTATEIEKLLNADNWICPVTSKVFASADVNAIAAHKKELIEKAKKADASRSNAKARATNTKSAAKIASVDQFKQWIVNRLKAFQDVTVAHKDVQFSAIPSVTSTTANATMVAISVANASTENLKKIGAKVFEGKLVIDIPSCKFANEYAKWANTKKSKVQLDEDDLVELHTKSAYGENVQRIKELNAQLHEMHAEVRGLLGENAELKKKFLADKVYKVVFRDFE